MVVLYSARSKQLVEVVSTLWHQRSRRFFVRESRYFASLHSRGHFYVIAKRHGFFYGFREGRVLRSAVGQMV